MKWGLEAMPVVQGLQVVMEEVLLARQASSFPPFLLSMPSPPSFLFLALLHHAYPPH